MLYSLMMKKLSELWFKNQNVELKKTEVSVKLLAGYYETCSETLALNKFLSDGVGNVLLE